VKTRFQKLPFKCNLQRYTADILQEDDDEGDEDDEVELCTLNQALSSYG
jgi:hypothetical protein